MFDWRKIHVSLAAALAFVLMGCAPQSNVQAIRSSSPTDVAFSVQRSTSEFESYVKYLGPPIDICGSTYQLRSWVDKESGETDHQLYVVDFYVGDWKFWNWANNDRGEPLRFEEINREVLACPYQYLGCEYREVFGISIDDEFMRERMDSGFRLKIYSRNGYEAVLDIPATLVKGQLAAIDPDIPNVQRGTSGFEPYVLQED